MYPTPADYEHITNTLYATGPCMLILRGPSGSGKSSLGATLERNMPGAQSFEADDFFMLGNRYVFRSDLLKYAHGMCLTKVARRYFERGPRKHWCIVANTGIKRGPSEYEEVAALYGHKVLYYKMPALRAYEAGDKIERQKIVSTLAMKNLHKVSEKIIEGQFEKLIQSEEDAEVKVAYI